ncbi:FAD/NAD(P)-binding domain-containing protein [Mytilinidion resinicola]|uniref:FAD/NAD(P)-binding domain-containing protein n=1 Tax=Mytilinidion resinicola TaxID=574789 RepID=A0A6A6Y2V0_9PEZI|nr:FAD/NAD(P)-binding domain-containing protein [Mytilinidion resinicola]KAF2803141.1 FAD/NAD(P)-binding domain-containing protein [Mytilinidion resinicola]
MSPIAAPRLHGTPYEYNFMTTPQPHVGNRALPNFGGKLLSGSSGVNYGLWTRGHSVDYDTWAESVGDDRWSYERMLKYFKRMERYYNPDETVFNALTKSGAKFNPDRNGGNPIGLGAFTENWTTEEGAHRQPASKAYDLSEASTTKTAKGVVLVDGRMFTASKAAIVSSGALKTPQLLMLSGIGPAEHLAEHGIESIANLPVGQNLHDHISASLFWKLRNTERGLALGSPFFNKPEFGRGNPFEWLVTSTIPPEDLKKVIAKDSLSPNDPYIHEPRGHVETMVAYAPIAGGGSDFKLPFDGTHISTPVVLLLTASRGTVTLANTDPNVDPIIDSHYLETEADKQAMRTGLRVAMRAMETEDGQSMVVGETPPPGHKALTSSCSDADIDERLAIIGSSFFQNAGTAAMVCVLPLPIAAHYQAPMYAFGEAMADVILGKA